MKKKIINYKFVVCYLPEKSKYKSFINSILILILIIFPLLSPFNFTEKINSASGAKEQWHVYDFDVAIGTSNKLYTVYRENYQDIDRICFVETISGFEWNKTIQIIKQENDTYKLFGKPTITFENNRLLIVIAFQKNNYWGLEIFSRSYQGGAWGHQIIINNVNNTVLNPIIRYYPNTMSIWLTWRDSHEGSYNQYFIKTNSSSIDWSNITKLSEDNTLDCSDCDFIIDENGTAHFVWSEGPTDFGKILYRSVYNNGTITSIEYITDGSTNCEDPALVIDSSNLINVFWTNRTVIDPEEFLGTIFIHSSIRLTNNTWSKPLEVAPYIPTERPASGESDGLKPGVAFDTHNQLWLAYEIIEEYAYHVGVDIRYRIGNSWQPCIYLSLYSNRAYDPLLLVDNYGNLHCFWIDSRHITMEVYHRIKYENNVWSEEILVTGGSTFFGTDAFIIIIVVIGGAVLLSIPVMILRRLRQRREKRKVLDTIRGLR